MWVLIILKTKKMWVLRTSDNHKDLDPDVAEGTSRSQLEDRGVSFQLSLQSPHAPPWFLGPETRTCPARASGRRQRPARAARGAVPDAPRRPQICPARLAARPRPAGCPRLRAPLLGARLSPHGGAVTASSRLRAATSSLRLACPTRDVRLRPARPVSRRPAPLAKPRIAPPTPASPRPAPPTLASSRPRPPRIVPPTSASHRHAHTRHAHLASPRLAPSHCPAHDRLASFSLAPPISHSPAHASWLSGPGLTVRGTPRPFSLLPRRPSQPRLSFRRSPRPTSPRTISRRFPALAPPLSPGGGLTVNSRKVSPPAETEPGFLFGGRVQRIRPWSVFGGSGPERGEKF